MNVQEHSAAMTNDIQMKKCIRQVSRRRTKIITSFCQTQLENQVHSHHFIGWNDGKGRNHSGEIQWERHSLSTRNRLQESAGQRPYMLLWCLHQPSWRIIKDQYSCVWNDGRQKVGQPPDLSSAVFFIETPNIFSGACFGLFEILAPCPDRVGSKAMHGDDAVIIPSY